MGLLPQFRSELSKRKERYQQRNALARVGEPRDAAGASSSAVHTCSHRSAGPLVGRDCSLLIRGPLADCRAWPTYQRVLSQGRGVQQ